MSAPGRRIPEPMQGRQRFEALIPRLGNGRSVFGIEVPLRVCPLGAHIDHQLGVVTGMTVDRSVVLAVEPSADSRIDVESLDFPGTVTVDLTEPLPPADGSWGDYLRAGVSVLGDRASLSRGFRAVIGGPLAGAGLSSSAAVLIAYITAMARVNEVDLPTGELPTLVQRAENEYVGVSCGLLDPSVIVHSRADALTVIDCLDGSVRRVAGSSNMDRPAVLTAYSGEARSLATSDFNRRVDECAQSATRLLELAGLEATAQPRLRSVAPEVFAEFGRRLPEPLRLRATHFFGEMNRVAAGVAAWERGDLDLFGELVTESGESSISNYECGTPAMVSLFRLLADHQGVYGARFSGAGFGGSCLALVRADAAEEIADAVERRLADARPTPAGRAKVHICRSAGSFHVFEGGD